MVAPNRNLENIHFVSIAFTTSTVHIYPFPSAIEMDIDKVNNFDNIRERSQSLSNISSRSAFLVSRASSKLYHKRMMINNDLPDEEIVESIDRSQLFYSGNDQGRNQGSMATTLFPPKDPNVFQTRYQLLTPAVFLILIIMTSLTFNYYMTLISLQNLNCGMVTSITFLFTVC